MVVPAAVYARFGKKKKRVRDALWSSHSRRFTYCTMYALIQMDRARYRPIDDRARYWAIFLGGGGGEDLD